MTNQIANPPTTFATSDRRQDVVKTASPDDVALLPTVVAAVQSAGSEMKIRFSRDSRRTSRQDINASIGNNDDVSLGLLQAPLLAARPSAKWVEDELAGGALPPGEWWVTDPVEGAINNVHGMTDWGVTATLVRENLPVLAVVHLPLTGETYTAVRGDGAYLDGTRLYHSAKSDLKAALVGTGQAAPGEDHDTHRRIGQSVTAMLEAALVVRVSVPATLQLIQVAAGRMDAFWQFSQVRSGLLAGALLVEEAGGILSDVCGRPWNLASSDFLAAAPGVHAAAVRALLPIR
ncbi:inositol monophosphatase family protein [Bradyrhizobium sp. OAE829]|uniref:inositol monophosphatase family protein n=1 Tax=Bradyrhizobium sp. OAE829 TaxID=2663807 RepID=UPI001788F3E8